MVNTIRELIEELKQVKNQDARPMIWVDHVRYPVSLVDDLDSQVDINVGEE